MNKNTIKKFAIEARKKLIDSVTDKAYSVSQRNPVVNRLLRGQTLKYIRPLREQKLH
jgi:hypothetical protein